MPPRTVPPGHPGGQEFSLRGLGQWELFGVLASGFGWRKGPQHFVTAACCSVSHTHMFTALILEAWGGLEGLGKWGAARALVYEVHTQPCSCQVLGSSWNEAGEAPRVCAVMQM